MAEKVKGITLDISLELSQFKSKLGEMTRETKIAEEKVKELQKQLKMNPENTQLLNDYNDAVKELANISQKTKTQLQEFYDESRKGANALEVTDDKMKAVNKDLGVVTARLDAANGKFTEFGEKIANAGQEADSTKQDFSELGEEITDIKDAVQGSFAFEVAKAGLSVLTDIAKELFSYLKQCTELYVDILKTGVDYNATMETYFVNLRAMLDGDEERTNQLITSMKQLASVSGFSVDALISGNRALISTGLSADDAEKTITALGNAIAYAGGSNDELSRMATNLQQIKNQGKTTAMDLRQFATAGVPIYSILADYLGKTAEQIGEMQSNGEITFEYISGALIKASEAGGTFFGAMERNASTLNGQINLLEMNWNELQGALAQDLTADLRDSFLPMLNQAVQEITMAFSENGLAGLRAQLAEWLPKVLDSVMEWLPDIIDTFTQIIISVTDAILANKDEIMPHIKALIRSLADLSSVFAEEFYSLGKVAVNSFFSAFREDDLYWQYLYGGKSTYRSGGGRTIGSGSLGIESGGIGINTTINVTNNGTPIDTNTIRQWSSEITDAVSQELARRN